MSIASLPHLEVLALVGGLGIASAAAWTANELRQRARALERDVQDLRREIHWLRREVVTLSVTEAPGAQGFEPLYQRLDAVPEDRRGALSGPRMAATEPPDVQEIAAELGVQSPEAIERLLSGTLSFGAAAREMGTGRQEARLLCWLHGRPEAGRSDA